MNAIQIFESADTQPKIFEMCKKHSVAEESKYESETQIYFFEDGSKIEMCGSFRQVSFFDAGSENSPQLNAFKTIDY